MSNPYNQDLDRNPANYQPLTPLTFLERAASVFPDYIAIIHGSISRSYAEFYRRSKQLASSLAKKGLERGDTVSVMLANTPEMLESHYGVPMCGAVLHSINTRLDAATVAYQLDHAEAKVLIFDREFHSIIKKALKISKVKPLLIDCNDIEFPIDDELPNAIGYEEFLSQGDDNYAFLMPEDELDAI